MNQYDLVIIRTKARPSIIPIQLQAHLLQGQRFGWINTTGFNDLQDLSAELKMLPMSMDEHRNHPKPVI